MARDVTLVLKSDSEDGTSAVERWQLWLTSPKRWDEGVLQILRGSFGLWSPETRCGE